MGLLTIQNIIKNKPLILLSTQLWFEDTQGSLYKIVVDRTLNTYYCIERDGKMVCPVNQNKDKSSSFIPIDIKLLKKLFSNENIIVASKGF